MDNDKKRIGYVDDHGYVTYGQLRRAMQGEPFPFEAKGDEARAVVAAVNEGIDAHLEACNCANRGDSYVSFQRRLDPRDPPTGIKASVSPESLPVLLRRLIELPAKAGKGRFKALTEEQAEAGEGLALAIVDMLLSPPDKSSPDHPAVR